MANSLFNQLNRRPTQMDALNSLMSNPAEFVKGRGYSIPQGMTNPRQIISHLIQSGQIGGNNLTQIQQMLKRM